MKIAEVINSRTKLLYYNVHFLKSVNEDYIIPISKIYIGTVPKIGRKVPVGTYLPVRT